MGSPILDAVDKRCFAAAEVTYGAPSDMPVPHVYGGEIIGVSYEGDETIVRVKLDKADERIRKAHVLIIDAGREA